MRFRNKVANLYQKEREKTIIVITLSKKWSDFASIERLILSDSRRILSSAFIGDAHLVDALRYDRLFAETMQWNFRQVQFQLSTQQCSFTANGAESKLIYGDSISCDSKAIRGDGFRSWWIMVHPTRLSMKQFDHSLSIVNQYLFVSIDAHSWFSEF